MAPRLVRNREAPQAQRHQATRRADLPSVEMVSIVTGASPIRDRPGGLAGALKLVRYSQSEGNSSPERRTRK